jgi:hypothetical protein
MFLCFQCWIRLRPTFLVICFPCCVLGLIPILVNFHARDSLNKLPSSLRLFLSLLLLFILFFLVEVECGLPLYFKRKSFQEVVDYPPFERVVEIVDHPSLIVVLIYIYFWPCPFQGKK